MRQHPTPKRTTTTRQTRMMTRDRPKRMMTTEVGLTRMPSASSMHAEAALAPSPSGPTPAATTQASRSALHVTSSTAIPMFPISSTNCRPAATKPRASVNAHAVPRRGSTPCPQSH
eukprot:2435946-Rhodomonas_salina.2